METTSSQRIPFFCGEFELVLDPKNRLMVPSDIRRRSNPQADGLGLFVTLRDKVVIFYPEKFYEELVNSQIPSTLTPSKELLQYTQYKFALASWVEWDAQGRIVLPDRIRKRAGLERDVTLIGARDHMELWDRAEWNKYREMLIYTSSDVEERAAKEFRQRQSM